MSIAVRPWGLKLCATVAAAFVVAMTLLPVSGAGAAPTWLSAQDLSATGQSALTPQVSINQAGDSVAVWLRSDGSNTLAQSSFRLAGGSWSVPEKVSLAGTDSSGPQIGIDTSGTAVAVWERTSPSYRILASTHPAGGAWSAPVNLSDEVGVLLPQLAVNAAGDAAAIWHRAGGGSFVTQVATRPAGGAWSAAQDLWPTGAPIPDTGDGDVALDPAGNAIAVWYQWDSATSAYVIMASYRPAGGAWSAPQSISAAGQSAYYPRVALDAGGNAVAVWDRSNGANSIVQAATRPAGGAWSVPQDLSAPLQSASEQQVAVDPAGNAAAVWTRSNGANTIAQASSRPAGGVWGAPQNLSASGESAAEPEVAVDPSGNAIAVWRRGSLISGPGLRIEEAVRQPAGGWTASTVLSAEGQHASQPHVAMDPRGNGVAIWRRSNGTNNIIQAAGYDATGPQLGGLSVPSSGVAGQALGFSVSPLDVWSPVASVDWSFGDGGSASGTTVTHSYSAPGTYAVQVTATDAVGNSSTASGGVVVSAGADSGPNAGADTAAPTVTVKAPKRGKRYRGRALRRVRGTATDSSGVANVSYAIQTKVKQKRARGAKQRKARCRDLQKNGRLSKLKSCKTVGYLAASGTTSWSAKLKKALPRGSATVYVRATDAVGNTSAPVTVRFRVA